MKYELQSNTYSLSDSDIEELHIFIHEEQEKLSRKNNQSKKRTKSKFSEYDGR